MNNRDRALLRDLIHFTYKNRLAAVYIFRHQLHSREFLEEVAVYAESRFRASASREDILESVRTYNDAKRIEQIICAKIFAEYVSACEDLGALGDAIRHRANGGIFQRYLSSTTAQAATFFDQHVLAHDVERDATITVQHLLDLPPLDTLAQTLPPAQFRACQQSYRDQALNLFAAASTYREVGESVEARGIQDALSDKRRDEIHIVLDRIPAGSASKQKGGIFPRTLNKIKHRFMVTERLSEYAEPGSADEIEYAFLRPQAIDGFIDNTVAVAGTIAELAAMVIGLDAEGVPI